MAAGVAGCSGCGRATPAGPGGMVLNAKRKAFPQHADTEDFQAVLVYSWKRCVAGTLVKGLVG